MIFFTNLLEDGNVSQNILDIWHKNISPRLNTRDSPFNLHLLVKFIIMHLNSLQMNTKINKTDTRSTNIWNYGKIASLWTEWWRVHALKQPYKGILHLAGYGAVGLPSKEARACLLSRNYHHEISSTQSNVLSA